jgi:hypothetical protein
LEHFVATSIGKREIEHDDIPPCARSIDSIEGFVASGNHEALEVLGFERSEDHVADEIVVLDDENGALAMVHDITMVARNVRNGKRARASFRTCTGEMPQRSIERFCVLGGDIGHVEASFSEPTARVAAPWASPAVDGR